MAGLVFSDTPAPDPATPVVGWMSDWLESLVRVSPRTQVGYISDVGSVAAALIKAVGRELPEAIVDPRALEIWVRRVESVSRSGVDAELYGVLERSRQRSKARGRNEPALSVRALLRCHAGLATLHLADLAPSGLARALNRLGATTAPATAQRQRAAFGSLMRYLVGQEVLATNPLDSPAILSPTLPKRRSSALSSDEMRRLFLTVATRDERSRNPWPSRDFALIVFLASTGIRESEAIDLVVRDVVVEPDVGYRVTVVGKGSKARTVPLHDEAAAALTSYLEDRVVRLGGPLSSTMPLFARANGQALNPSSLYRLVARSFERSGVDAREGSMVHALRHTFATHALDSGASILEVQRLMGHESLETTRRYLDVVGDGLAAAVAHHPTRSLLADMGTSKP